MRVALARTLALSPAADGRSTSRSATVELGERDEILALLRGLAGEGVGGAREHRRAEQLAGRTAR